MNKITILLVEDNRECRIAVRECLNVYGFAVSVASDGVDALVWLSRFGDPDVILLDLRMPIMTGAEFLAMYQGGAPVIITSAYDKPDLDKPVAGYMQKPFMMSELAELICNTVKTPKEVPEVPVDGEG